MGKGKKHKINKNVREQKGSNDLLLPILIVLAVLPFVIYFKVYQSGLARFDWFGIDDTVTDFYTYYKSRLIIILAVFCMITLAFRMPLYPEKRKQVRLFLPLAAYAALVIVSAFFSIDTKLSLFGAPYTLNETAKKYIGDLTVTIQ